MNISTRSLLSSYSIVVCPHIPRLYFFKLPLQNRVAQTRKLRIARDCNFIKTNVSYEATFSGWRAVRATLGKDAGHLGRESCDKKLTKESRKNFDASNVEYR